MTPEELKKIIISLGYARKYFCDFFGIAQSSLSEYESGKTRIPRILINFLAFAQEEKRKEGMKKLPESVDEDYHQLQEWHPKEKLEKKPNVKILALKKWVEEEFNTIPENLYIYRVRTNGGSPQFRAGDIVIVDLGSKEIIGGVPYLLVDPDGEPMLRQLQKMLSKKTVRMYLEGTTVQEEEIQIDGSSGIGIIGRVIWTAKRN